MSKKTKIIAIGAVLGTTVIAFASGFTMQGLGFVAPTINGKSNVSSAATGEMVYDTSDSAFYGYSGSSWLKLSDGVVNGYASTNPATSNVTLTTSSQSSQAYNPTSSDINVTLDNSFLAGRRMTVINNGSTYKILVKANNGNTIRTVYPNTSGDVLCVNDSPSSDTDWKGISPIISNWASYSNTYEIGPHDSSNYPHLADTHTLSKQWRRVGDSMEILFTYRHTNNTGATPGTGTYLFPLPSGYTIDTGKVSASGDRSIVGTGIGSVSGSYYWGEVGINDTSNLVLYMGNEATNAGTPASSGGIIPMNSSIVLYSFTARVPISGWTTNED